MGNIFNQDFINFNDLILAKKASARSKDINDIENLEEIKNKKDF